MAATSMAFACGAAWWAIRGVRGAAYFNFLLAAGFGYAIGEVVSRSVNRKRGRSLAFIAGTTVVIGYVIGIFPPWGLWFGGFSPFGLLAVALGVYLAVSRAR